LAADIQNRVALGVQAMATSDLDRTLQRWKELAELQIQWVETLGIYKLDTAKSELVQSVAAGQWAVARIKATVAQELSVALKRLHRARARLNRRAERLNRHARDIAKLRSGQDLDAGQLSRAWAAYTVFERLAPVDVVATMINEPLSPSATRGSSYADPRQLDRICPDPPPQVNNVHALLQWLKKRRFVVRRGTQAYRQVLAAVHGVAAVAPAEIERLNQSLQAMERGTWDAWQPVALAALPDSVDVNKIIKLGSR